MAAGIAKHQHQAAESAAKTKNARNENGVA